MDINEVFNKFLKDEVDLDPARYKRMEKAREILVQFISNQPEFKNLYVGAIPQGSSRQGTVIKPVNIEVGFDLDLLIEFKENPAWSPKDYILKLAKVFKDSGRYEDLTETSGKTRCVTIDYEGDFHVDLVPAIKRGGKYVIFNKNTDREEPTDGDGYAQWFAGQNALAKGHLVNVVKLIKYLRDRNKDFDTRSIIITTLAGMVVPMGNHNSLPESLTTILSGMKYLLDSSQNPPTIPNPAMPGETFNRHWKTDNSGFKKLKNTLNNYSGISNKALVSAESEAIKKWKELFGDKFYKLNPAETLFPGLKQRDTGEQFLGDLGVKENIQHSIRINAKVIQNGWQPFTLRGSSKPLRKQRKLEFRVDNCDAPQPYSLKWKVKNTGQEAIESNDLRGEITDDLGWYTKKENTKYAGAHYVECYVIKNGICVAKDRLDVPIGSI